VALRLDTLRVFFAVRLETSAGHAAFITDGHFYSSPCPRRLTCHGRLKFGGGDAGSVIDSIRDSALHRPLFAPCKMPSIGLRKIEIEVEAQARPRASSCTSRAKRGLHAW
jgi:hypothetical protein